MKRRLLIEKLLEMGAVFVREGGEHTVYRNPRTGFLLSVPRHVEVSAGVTRDLLQKARK